MGLPGAHVDPWLLRWSVVLGSYAWLVATSGWVVTGALSWADDGYTDEITGEERDVGALVGKAENALLLTFLFAGSYTGLAVIFAAKGLVRGEDMKNNSLYYFAGTLVNFTYSVLVGVGAQALLGATGLGLPVL